jgi:antitoxin VapB
MGISIKNPRLEQDIRTLAARTGQSLTDAVATAVKEKLSRTRPSEEETSRRMQVLRRIQKNLAKGPRNDDLTEDEILGYNEHGHFD